MKIILTLFLLTVFTSGFANADIVYGWAVNCVDQTHPMVGNPNYISVKAKQSDDDAELTIVQSKFPTIVQNTSVGTYTREAKVLTFNDDATDLSLTVHRNEIADVGTGYGTLVYPGRTVKNLDCKVKAELFEP